MSNQSATTFFASIPARIEPLGSRRHRALVMWDRISPSQGWATFAILALTLSIVSESITAAEWIQIPGLTSTLLLAALIGLGLAKIRLPWIVAPLVGLALGAMFIIWRASSLLEGESTAGRIRELFDRLDIWYQAAVDGGISTDLLPFIMLLLTAAWILGFFSSWFIFRWNNVWVAVVLAGLAILTNLSFLPDTYAARFFLFMLMAMLLVVRMDSVRRHEVWRRLQIGFTPAGSWLTLHASLWLSLLVLMIAALLPLKIIVSDPIADFWRTARSPVARVEDTFTRLFSTLPSRKDTMGRFFGKTLPFMGKISFGGDVVAWADTEFPSYWLSQAYNFYTSQGWIASGTERIDVGPSILPPPSIDNRKREAVEQTIQLSFESRKYLSGGGFDWVSRPATIESLDPREFEINLNDPSNDAWYPPDIQELAEVFRADINEPRLEPDDVFVAGKLPDDLVLLDMVEDELGGIETITLQRKAQIAPDLVAWLFKDTLPENAQYRVISMVSVAEDDDLRGADTNYNRFISDHYLQLPPTLPERVSDKAEEVTAGMDNPLDKAVAIRDYLRGSEFTYSQDIDAPPRDTDGVDHFLFETKEGYSDYFGSAMTVMLRSVGVPARLAAGYAPGELEPQSEMRFIKDSDSHGWSQVYFPEYGWIDFEPTPYWPAYQRLIPDETVVDFGGGLGEGDSSLIDPEDMLDSFDDGFEEEGAGGGSSLADRAIDLTGYLIPIAIVVGVLTFVALLGRLMWNIGLGGLSTEERLYTKMSRLGFLAGLRRRPHQTPWEYARTIAQVVPSAEDNVGTISEAYARIRYGRRPTQDETEPDEEKIDNLNAAWNSARWRLLGRAFSRLTPQSRQARAPAR